MHARFYRIQGGPGVTSADDARAAVALLAGLEKVKGLRGLEALLHCRELAGAKAASATAKRFLKVKPDAEAQAALHRAARAASSEGEPRRFKLVAATAEPADVGQYMEQLSIDAAAVDTRAAVSLLLNHDRNQICGGIESIAPGSTGLRAVVKVDPEAVTRNALPILRAVERGYLKGVSIGYDYKAADCVLTERDGELPLVFVKRWILREISLTPAALDPAALVEGKA